MSKKAVTRAWLDVKHRFAEVQAESIYALVNAVVEQKIKEALYGTHEVAGRNTLELCGCRPGYCADDAYGAGETNTCRNKKG